MSYKDCIAFNIVTDITSDGFWVLDLNGSFVDINQHYIKMSGYRKEDLLKMNINDIDFFSEQYSAQKRILAVVGKSFDNYKSIHRRADGSTFPVEGYLSHQDSKSEYIYVFIRDVSVQQSADIKINIVEQIFNNSIEAIMVTDHFGTIELVNDTFCKITGYSHEEVMGKTPAMLNSGRQDKHFYRKFWQQLTTDGRWIGEIWNKRKNGEVYPEWLTISSVRNNEQEITHFIAQFSDISATKRSEEEKLFHAYHDPLTALPNRTLLFERLENLCEQHKEQPTCFAVLFCDLDRFKFINDSLGHHIGDEVLKRVAQRIQRKLRINDTIARVGGDEFIIVIEGEKPLKNIEHVANQILELFEQPFVLEYGEFYISASIGISTFPQDSTDIRELISFADIAMYQIKVAGGNHYNLFDKRQKDNIKHKIELEKAIHHALKEEQFEVWYQPQINSQTHEVYGIECLVRWIHPEYGLIRPDLFIPIAEDNGLIKDIGYFVLKSACKQLRKWRLSNTFTGIMAINISLKQFERNDLVSQVKTVLAEELIPGDTIELEVTESLFSEDNLYHVAVLEEIRNLGVKISIDDFGTGYSSLQRLKQLPIDNLKIDKCFVDNITTSKQDVSIITALSMLVKTFGIGVIAEGVEQLEQAEMLNKLGCANHQGFLYSKPLPADEFEVWLQKYQQHHN